MGQGDYAVLMPGFRRYSAILRLFTEREPAWTVPAMAVSLGVPASTVYRTVRELLAESFLEPASEARYRLGAAFIVFDRLTRMSDPLVAAGAPVLDALARQAEVPCVGLLCRLFDETVMCIADAVQGQPAFRSSYERGRPMPLAQGATSKVILAQLPPRRLIRLLARQGLEDDGKLRAELAAVRRYGFLVSHGEIDDGLVGLAAPVMTPGLDTVASLTVVVEQAALDARTEQRLTLLLVASAGLLGKALATAGEASARQDAA